MTFNEADTRAKLIDPTIHKRGWTEELIKREETAGAIEIIEGKPKKRSKGKVDYLLRIKINIGTQALSVAIIEAKAEHLPPAHGLEQAKLYADCKRLNVPFVFSTNGHLFVEYDSLTGKTSSPKQLTEFPTPDELQSRYEKHHGFKLTDPVAKPLLIPYPGGEATRRYYQDAAIRAVLEKIAKSEQSGQLKRALLSLATGAGKTFIAVHLLKKIGEAGLLKRALFICDRDELRSQGLGVFQNVFGTDAAEVYKKPDGTNNAKNARIHIATYQTLDVDNDDGTANFLTTFYPENYFSHIIIDECHRSAWGKWSEVLKRNPQAVQIGLTATPRQLKVTEKTKETQIDEQINADNLRHFGEPVYEYDMAQGIEDGYLAACEIQKGRVNLDETGIKIDDIISRQPTDANTGESVHQTDIRPVYGKADFEDKILLPDRVFAMCSDLFQFLLDTGGPEQKTIIFCVRDRHADAVAVTLNNLYADWCNKNNCQRLEPYAFKCTASVDGNQYLADLRGASRSHFIATTVDLLSTGVDVPVVRNIVFFKYVRSPIAFYQMVGRGTRLDPPSNKLMFRIYDYTNATRLFGEDFKTKYGPGTTAGPGTEPLPPEPIINVKGFDVRITDAGRYILTMVDGRAMPVTVEEYKEKLAAKLVEEAPTINEFRKHWIIPQERGELIEHLPDGGRSAILIRALEDMGSYDLYDVLAEIGYGSIPKTRIDRVDAFTYKHEEWLKNMPAQTSNTVKALASQFANNGTESLENPHIFQVPEVVRAGGLEALRLHDDPSRVLTETKERIFAA